MAIEITVPRLGWTMEEGTFLGWLKQEGEPVRTGEPLFALESEKAAQEIEATESGILRIDPHAPAAGGLVRVGSRLGVIAEPGEVVTFETPSAIRNAPPPGPPAVPATSAPARSRPDDLAQSRAITISPRAARTAAALGVDWTTLRGTGRTGRIRERDVLANAPKP